MNKNVIAIVIVLTVLLCGFSFFIGLKCNKLEEGTNLVISSKLEPVTDLGVASTDILELVEICLKKRWLCIKGKGRLLLMAANKYYYSLEWDPQKDIKSTKFDPETGTHDISVNVRKINIKMGPEPKNYAYTTKKSIFINEEKEKYHFTQAMHKRLLILAWNKLGTKEGLSRLTEAIKNHIYKIYATEKSKINDISVKYQPGAIQKPLEYKDYRFKQECRQAQLIEIPK